MKKIWRSSLLLALLSAFLLVGCAGEPEPTTGAEPTQAVVETPVQETTPEPETEPTTEPELDCEPETEPTTEPEPEPATEPTATQPTSGEVVTDLIDIANSWIELDGTRFTLGMTLDDFLSIPGVQPLISDIPTSYLGSRAATAVLLQRQNAAGRWNAALSVSVANDDNSPILFPDGRIRSISIRETDAQLWDDVAFINGIRLGDTTPEDIITMFGEPNRGHEGNIEFTMDYEVSGIGYVFTFNNETRLLVGVRMSGPLAGRN